MVRWKTYRKVSRFWKITDLVKAKCDQKKKHRYGL